VERKLLAKRFFDVDDAAAEVAMAEMQRLFPGYEGMAGLYIIEDIYRRAARGRTVVAAQALRSYAFVGGGFVGDLIGDLGPECLALTAGAVAVRPLNPPLRLPVHLLLPAWDPAPCGSGAHRRLPLTAHPSQPYAV
jgi:hypothetical protein